MSAQRGGQAASRFIMLTGASGGIGRATVVRLADAGHVVFAAARGARELQALAAAHPGVRPVVLDVTDQDSIDRAGEQIAAETDGRGLDVLVNAAGILVLGPMEAVSDQQTRAQFGRRAFFGYVVDPAGGTVWFANVPRPPVGDYERQATTAQQWQRQLLELFTSDRGPATDLIAAGRLEFAGDNTHDLPQVPTWQRGPMVIIGDAAHAPAPTSGQGASLAAEDAVVLAKCLRHQPNIGQALGVYERLRRPRVERIVAQAARTSSTKTPGLVGRLLRDLMLPVVFRFLSPTGRWRGRYDHHIDWDAPITLTTKPA